MRNIVLVIIIVWNNFSAFAQHSYYQYSYDAAGNRTQREVITFSPSPPAPNHNNDTTGPDSISGNNTEFAKLDNQYDNGNENKPEKHEEHIGDKVITIYPNPTTGVLRVEITGIKPGNTGMIIITEMAGKTIRQIENISSSNELNLRDLARGNYILQIRIDGVKREWEIVKF